MPEPLRDEFAVPLAVMNDAPLNHIHGNGPNIYAENAFASQLAAPRLATSGSPHTREHTFQQEKRRARIDRSLPSESSIQQNCPATTPATSVECEQSKTLSRLTTVRHRNLHHSNTASRKQTAPQPKCAPIICAQLKLGFIGEGWLSRELTIR